MELYLLEIGEFWEAPSQSFVCKDLDVAIKRMYRFSEDFKKRNIGLYEYYTDYKNKLWASIKKKKLIEE